MLDARKESPETSRGDEATKIPGSPSVCSPVTGEVAGGRNETSRGQLTLSTTLRCWPLPGEPANGTDKILSCPLSAFIAAPTPHPDTTKAAIFTYFQARKGYGGSQAFGFRGPLGDFI